MSPSGMLWKITKNRDFEEQEFTWSVSITASLTHNIASFFQTENTDYISTGTAGVQLSWKPQNLTVWICFSTFQKLLRMLPTHKAICLLTDVIPANESSGTKFYLQCFSYQMSFGLPHISFNCNTAMFFRNTDVTKNIQEPTTVRNAMFLYPVFSIGL